MVAAWLTVVAIAAFPVPPLVKTPSWVIPVEVSQGGGGSSGAVRMLLNDSQVRVGKTVERHRHLAWKVLSQAGIQDVARQQLDWDPSWQTLELNGVWVWRNGVRRDAWKPEDARVIQREEGLNEGIYDGRLSLLIELRDVREGDVVEVASTRRGENPVYKGHFTHEEWLAWGQDLARSHFRLTWERQRPLQFKAHGGAQVPTETRSEGRVIYAWDQRDLESRPLDPRIPNDLEPRPWVEFSDWNGWSEVATWADALFSQRATGAAFEREVARVKALPAAERISALIRFVQDDVRYVGVELGEHSHLPHAPQWVLERGFGDCKDKSLLLVALLRASGVEASPVLVNSELGSAVPARLASAHVFDHAIVRVMHEGRARFVDPTMTLRRGSFEHFVDAEYDFGLVVKAGESGLTVMPRREAHAPTWEATQHWKVPSASGRSTLTITTVARGHEASSLRRHVASESVKALEREFREDREDSFDHPLELLSLRWSDDEGTEAFTLVEEYAVENAFPSGKRHFSLFVIPHDLPQLPTQKRSWPYSLSYPLRVKERILYEAPNQNWSDYELLNKTFEHDTFRLTMNERVDGDRLELEWELQTLADRVQPAQFESYRKVEGEARDLLGYRATFDTSPPRARERPTPDPFWSAGIFVGAIFLVFGGIAVASRISDRWDRRRVRGFQTLQRGTPGELASEPAVLPSLELALGLFSSKRCARGHVWHEPELGDGVRLGDERITVLVRRCSGCELKEHRYVKLPQVTS